MQQAKGTGFSVRTTDPHGLSSALSSADDSQPLAESAMIRERSYVHACVPDDDAEPSCLLYLLPAGRDRELVLTVHGLTPSTGDLASWLRSRSVVSLTASREGVDGTFPVTVDFAHVLLVRTAPPTLTRHSTF
jgi:hypothetical protein